MNHTLQDALTDFRQTLSQELTRGCHDTTVQGGLEQFVAQRGQRFPKVQRVLRGYSAMNTAARGTSLMHALSLLPVQDALLDPDGETLPTPAVQCAAARPQGPVTPRAIAGNGSSLPALTPLNDLGFTPRELKLLSSLGRVHLRDVLHTYPSRHEDRRVVNSLRGLADKDPVTIQGTILSRERRQTGKGGLFVITAVIETDVGNRIRATWFNQEFMYQKLAEGQTVLISGNIREYNGFFSVQAKHLETLARSQSSDLSRTGKIVSVYPAKEGVNQDLLRAAARLALEHSDRRDYLTPRWRAEHDLIGLHDALSEIHFPSGTAQLSLAQARLKFDEYLFLELRMLLQGEDAVLTGRQFRATDADLQTFEAALPFRFTNAQRRVIGEILEDMRSDRQMARLVQGDVGSGKTAVAACALYLCTRDGYQGALMAPTEILARQHYEGLSRYLEPLGVRLGLLLGAMTPKKKTEMKERIASGDVDLVVGTQALIQDTVVWKALGLAVVDEEHRFGVVQRRKLLAQRPDVMVMSATPIPRSLALTSYGDLEISMINELPPGRTPVTTKIVFANGRREMYQSLRNDIEQGQQVYVVTALIDPNELLELQAATDLHEELTLTLPGVKIGLLHGKMSSAEKTEIMRQFSGRELELLVSTTVIEVGVDVPNATVMVIENAERFGLSQLHQLRGRVGRGTLVSRCYLSTEEPSKTTLRRLQVIEKSNDGFVIAEADLKLRGPGELQGTKQSGVPELQLGNLQDDVEIIEQARAFAKYLLSHDPALAHPGLKPLKEELQARSEKVSYREII